MVEALLVNSPSGGCVESVVTFATHLLDEGVDERGLMVAIACLEVQMLCKPIGREFRNLLKCPRSSKRWVAPGTIESCFSQRNLASAC